MYKKIRLPRLPSKFLKYQPENKPVSQETEINCREMFSLRILNAAFFKAYYLFS
jgi:hypothetical protein